MRKFLWIILAFVAGISGNIFAETALSDMKKRVLGPPTYGKVITATQFLVVDEQGRTRAALAMYGSSGPGIRLYDEDGSTRVAIDLEYGRTSIARVEKGRVVVELE